MLIKQLLKRYCWALCIFMISRRCYILVFAYTFVFWCLWYKPCFTYSHPAALMRQTDDLHVHPTKHLPWFTFSVSWDVVVEMELDQWPLLIYSYVHPWVPRQPGVYQSWLINHWLINSFTQSVYAFQGPSFCTARSSVHTWIPRKQTKGVLCLLLEKS